MRSMNDIYFDNSATTRVTDRAAAKAAWAMSQVWGNPSSVHGKGVEAERLISEARTQLLRTLGIRHAGIGQLFFTGSGTEADNMAVSGVLYSKARRGTPRIITTDSEHPAVANPIREAEAKGFEVVRLSTVGGVIDPAELEAALTRDTVLVSIMRVNNETGAVYDVPSLFSLVKERVPEAVTHCDAVQGFLKIGCEPQKLKADLLTISGHKIGAPKGIGALYCVNSLLTKKILRPIVYGGGQENGYRSGTENVPGIVAFAEAANEHYPVMQDTLAHITAVREAFIAHLPEGVIVNQPRGDYLPHLISLQVPGIKSEVLVRHLSSEGIYLSAGSACSSKKLKTSAVLTAFGLTPAQADTTVRISLGRDNTVEEAIAVADAIALARKSLARIR